MMRLEVDMWGLDEGAVPVFLRWPCRYLDMFSAQLNKTRSHKKECL
jgi:hypothetical protein